MLMRKNIETYLAWKATYISRWENYRFFIEKFEMIVQKPIDCIDINDIIKFNYYLKQKYSPKTIELGMTVIRNFFDFWFKQGLGMNPDIIKLPRKSVANSHRPITEEEYVKMLSVIKCSSPTGLQKNIIVRLLYDSGIRVGELCAIRKYQITAERSTVIQSEKTNKYRRIFWTEDTHKFLTEYCKIRQDRLFPCIRQVQRIVKEVCQSAGVQGIVCHSFRHGRAHRILNLGGNVKDVQGILGHTNPISSFHYLQFSDVELETRARKFL